MLAHLYQDLELATHKGSKSVAACVWLLQIWCYERFPSINLPLRDGSPDDYPVAEG